MMKIPQLMMSYMKQVDVEADCHIRKDLTVTEEGILEIKPGVTMRFDPAVVLGINGTLIAKVAFMFITGFTTQY